MPMARVSETVLEHGENTREATYPPRENPEGSSTTELIPEKRPKGDTSEPPPEACRQTTRGEKPQGSRAGVRSLSPGQCCAYGLTQQREAQEVHEFEQEVDLLALANDWFMEDIPGGHFANMDLDLRTLNTDEEGVAPSDMHIWPSAARPILAVSYLCPSETYKAAQQASVCCQVQSGRKHSRDYLHTCQTCLVQTPPRETKEIENTRQRDSLHCPTSPLREDKNSMMTASCPTRVMVMCQPCLNTMHCTGTRVAPSHRPYPPINSKLQNLLEGGIAWDKRERIGEASNPGPEPPRELYLDRKNGRRDPIRLCKQNGGWVWNVHSVPTVFPHSEWPPPHRMR